MEKNNFQRIDLSGLTTPCYLIDLALLQHNRDIVAYIKQRTGCTVLLALKAYAVYKTFALLAEVLDGVCASSVYEARLGSEEFGKQVHAYSPAYSETDFAQLLQYADVIIFNSIYQKNKFRPLAPNNKQYGIRVNPQYSEIEIDLYNPCSQYSRFGVLVEQLSPHDLEGIHGLHFHALCEQNADTLHRVVKVFEQRFSQFIPYVEWVNFGGGHHISRSDYNLNLLCEVIERFQNRYKKQVIIEPGEAIALNSGVLITEVLDIVHNGMAIAILDTSAEAHMPDVLAMPYRPQVFGADKPGVLPFTYRLAGNTCLAGDVIGDYSFNRALQRGDRLLLCDMAHYSIVKNTTFNGIRLPSIAIFDSRHESISVVRTFDYNDYKSRQS